MDLRVDGRRVFAYTGSNPFDPARETLVFIHGAGTDHTVWELQSRYFACHGRNVLALDLPGHGRSEGPPLATVEAMAGWMPLLLDAAGVATAAVAGHSMGSLVALETAARHPARIAAIALLGISVPMPVSEVLLAAARADDHAAVEMIIQWGHSGPARLGGNPAPGMWMRGGSARLLERSAPGVLYAGLRACNDYRGGLESARRVSCPALMLLGAGDRMTPPRAAADLAQALPASRTVVLERCGHLMMCEQPEPVLDALIEFLCARTPAREAGAA